MQVHVQVSRSYLCTNAEKKYICKMSLDNQLLAPINKIVKCVLILDNKVSIEISFIQTEDKPKQETRICFLALHHFRLNKKSHKSS